MNTSWQTKKIGQLGRVVTGKTPPTSKPELFDGPFPFITPGDLDFESRIPTAERSVSELGSYHLASNRLPAGSTVFVCIGGTIGKMGFTDRPSFSNQQINAVVPDGDHDPKFVYYLLRTVRREIQAVATGTYTKIVNKSVFSSMEVPVPRLDIQHRIAEILSAYDDLIENNNRRMHLLEESIHLLHREWFVYLRFPGYERTKIVDGVPEGWRLGKASDSVTVQSGGTPKTKVAEYWDGDIPFFTPKDAPDGVYVHDTEKTLTESGLRNCNSSRYPPDSLFITARGTVGKLALAQRGMAMNQSCYRLEPKPPFGPHFLYPAMGEVVRYLRAAAVGGVFNTIIVKTFDHVPMMLPSAATVREFEQSVEPLYQQLQVLAAQSRKLREARDLLLPRLMDGRIPV